MEPLPDLATLSDQDLKGLIDELTQEENEVSYRRRLLHGKIDIDAVDVESLTEILAGKAAPPA